MRRGWLLMFVAGWEMLVAGAGSVFESYLTRVLEDIDVLPGTVLISISIVG